MLKVVSLHNPPVRLMNMTFWRSVSAEEIDIAIKFTKREIQFLSGGSSEYQYAHQFEIHRIDRLQIGGDVEYIEEVALRYKNWFISPLKLISRGYF